jgi:hypothetical protein
MLKIGPFDGMAGDRRTTRLLHRQQVPHVIDIHVRHDDACNVVAGIAPRLDGSQQPITIAWHAGIDERHALIPLKQIAVDHLAQFIKLPKSGKYFFHGDCRLMGVGEQRRAA